MKFVREQGQGLVLDRRYRQILRAALSNPSCLPASARMRTQKLERVLVLFVVLLFIDWIDVFSGVTLLVFVVFLGMFVVIGTLIVFVVFMPS